MPLHMSYLPPSTKQSMLMAQKQVILRQYMSLYNEKCTTKQPMLVTQTSELRGFASIHSPVWWDSQTRETWRSEKNVSNLDILTVYTSNQTVYCITAATVSEKCVWQLKSSTPDNHKAMYDRLHYTAFFVSNSIFHLSLELLTKFWKTSLKVA